MRPADAALQAIGTLAALPLYAAAVALDHPRACREVVSQAAHAALGWAFVAGSSSWPVGLCLVALAYVAREQAQHGWRDVFRWRLDLAGWGAGVAVGLWA